MELFTNPIGALFMVQLGFFFLAFVELMLVFVPIWFFLMMFRWITRRPIAYKDHGKMY